MRRQIQGLHLNQHGAENKLEGLFLVRVDRARYRWHPQKPFVEIQFSVLEPKSFEGRSFSGRLYCTERALWKLNWFLRDFDYDAQLLKDDRVDEKALLNLRGVVRTSYTTFNGRFYQNLVRKHAPEIQYLRASISEEQRQEFGRLVETTIGQIEGAQFVSHSGIRFPQNGCVSCPHLGLCLNNEQLISANLIRKAGASDLDWLDELVD
jgi:hypothetical protein